MEYLITNPSLLGQILSIYVAQEKNVTPIGIFFFHFYKSLQILFCVVALVYSKIRV